MPEFLVTFPVWLLASEDSVVRNDRGKPIGLTERPGLDAIKDGNKVRLLAFTDKDLANRYVARHEAKWVPVGVDDPKQFVRWLRTFARAGGTSVLFDPEPVGTTYSIESVITSLEGEPE